MLPLMLILHFLFGATIGGSFVIVALVAGFDSGMHLFLAVAIGFVAGFPLSWWIFRKLA